MKIIVTKDYEELSKKAAEVVKDILSKHANPKLGLATGSTPEGLYKELIKIYENGDYSFRKAETVNLDEYVGIDEKNEQSYHYYMFDKLFNHIDIMKENIYIPSADQENLEEATKEYDKMLDGVGRRDVQVLGIGNNGHIAFNEPADQLNARTSIVELTESTIAANSRFFKSKEEVPTKAISMGIKDILNAQTIILLASGEKKREAVKKLLEADKLDTHFPASMLHLHRDVILIVDKDAMGEE